MWTPTYHRRPVTRSATPSRAALLGFAVPVVVACAAGLWMLRFGGLLLEPVAVDVGPCPGAAGPCTEVRCLFENQGPVRTKGGVVLDLWSIDATDPDGHRRAVREHRSATLDLAAGAREEVRREVWGMTYRRGGIMVRCMPWYAAPRLFRQLPMGTGDGAWIGR